MCSRHHAVLTNVRNIGMIILGILHNVFAVETIGEINISLIALVLKSQ
jgi:hypothetical protein